MNVALKNLLDLLQPEEIEKNVYLGHSQDLGWPRVFGGQVLAQASMAASLTVDKNRTLHSLHAYFLRPGNLKIPISYEVDLIRTGTSFTTRNVVAKQNGRAIFNMSASFHLKEEGFEHQIESPKTSGPENHTSDLENMRKIADKIPVEFREKLTSDRPFDARTIGPVDLLNPLAMPGEKQVWFKTVEKIPDDPQLHITLLAYASDFGIATTSLLPHGKTLADPAIQVASIDHGLWIHRPVKVDEWLLYVIDSPNAYGSRGFNQGKIFTQSGKLVASVTQESLIRKKSR